MIIVIFYLLVGDATDTDDREMLHDDVNQAVPDDVRVVQGTAEIEKVRDGGEVPCVDVERDWADFGRRVDGLKLVQGSSQLLDQPLGGVGIGHVQHPTWADTLKNTFLKHFSFFGKTLLLCT